MQPDEPTPPQPGKPLAQRSENPSPPPTDAPPGSWSPPSHVSVGRVLKPHGVRGEVKVEPLTPDPERFRKLKRVFATAPDGNRRKLTIVNVRVLADGVLLKFAEFDSPEAAAVVSGMLLEIPRSEARKAPPGEVLYADMIGLSALNAETGAFIGKVKAIISAGSDLLELETPAGDVLIPWVPEFVGKPDLTAGTVAITVIPGLLESQER